MDLAYRMSNAETAAILQSSRWTPPACAATRIVLLTIVCATRRFRMNSIRWMNSGAPLALARLPLTEEFPLDSNLQLLSTFADFLTNMPPPDRNAHTTKTANPIGRAPTDPRTQLQKAAKPLGSLQLRMPIFTNPNRQSLRLLPPGDELTLTAKRPGPYFHLLQESPYMGLADPFFTRVTAPAPESRVISNKEAASLVSDPNGEKVVLGSDLDLDPFNFSLDFVVRHLDLFHFKIAGVTFDLLHEPTGTVSFAFNPNTPFHVPREPFEYGPLTAAVTGTVLNAHLQRNGDDILELGLGVGGVSIDRFGKPSFPFGVTAELHDVFGPDISLLVSAGGTFVPRDDGNGFQLNWVPLVTVGITAHWWHP